MNNRSRFLLPLGAALLLGAALVLRLFLTGPEATAPAGAPPSTTLSPASPSASVSAPAATRAQPPAPVRSEPHAVAASEGRGATEVPIGPGDVVPEPEVANPPPQRNDPIEPELPQTPEWKHGKLVRMTELMERDVERLEEERLVAEANGNTEEAKKLQVRISRHRASLAKLHEQTAGLAGEVRQERAAQ